MSTLPQQLVAALDPETRAEVLRAEVAWFTEALTNARALGERTPQYLEGFASAVGWLELHLKMAESGSAS